MVIAKRPIEFFDARWKYTEFLGRECWKAFTNRRCASSSAPTKSRSSARSAYRSITKGELLSEHRPDLIVDGKVVVEVKSVERLAPIHWAQVLTYLRITSLNVGLLLNFNSPTLKAGTRRVVLNA
jgi:hypothetical protein